jgi:hypothetical protein
VAAVPVEAVLLEAVVLVAVLLAKMAAVVRELQRVVTQELRVQRVVRVEEQAARRRQKPHPEHKEKPNGRLSRQEMIEVVQGAAMPL